jgi:Tol biopolymer transport system component
MKLRFLVVAMMMAGVVQPMAQSSSARALLEAARKIEIVDGDLKTAIQKYQNVVKVAGSDRAVAVQALVRMGECYQKLGDAEARKIFEQVVREYGDQKDAVAIARARLGSRADGSDARMSFRQIWQLPDDGTRGGEINGTVSRDGRFLPYVDWAQYGNLFVHDFSSGTDRQLTTTATDGLPNAKLEQFALDTSFSRDGHLLAYSWFRGDTNRFELRVIDLRGDGVPQSRLLLDRPEIAWIGPVDWSPDGKWIAVRIQRPDKSGQIGLVSVSDGSLRVLKSLDWRGTTALQFSTDGNFLAYDVPVADNTEQRDIFVIAADATREVPAVVNPGQDMVIGWSRDGKRLLFESDRSGSMSLWSLPFANGQVDGQPELVRSDIGNVVSLGLADSGKLYLGTHGSGFDSGDVYVASIDVATGRVLSPPALAAPTYVGTNRFPEWSPDGRSMAYASLRRSGASSHVVIGVRSDTGQAREISPSPGLDMVRGLQWAPDGQSLIASGRDVKGRYGIFTVDARTGRSSLLVAKGERQNPLGLAGMSLDGKRLYYVVHNFGEPFLTVMERELASGVDRRIRQLDVVRGARVSPDGRYIAVRGGTPDKPSVSLLSTSGGELRDLLSPAASDFDGRLGWAPDSSAVYLVVRGGLLRLPLDGSGPRKVDLKWGRDFLGISLFSVHPDGQRIAFETQPVRKPTEIWVLENFLLATKTSN